MKKPHEFKTASMCIRLTPAKKKYLEDHYGSMLPKLISNFMDRMVSNAATGFKPEDIEVLKPVIQD